MRTTERQSIGEADSMLRLSNDELGEIWAQTVRSYAVRRTGSAREFWRKLLDEADIILVHEEFRRRALERAEEYDAWVQLDAWPAS